MQNIQFISFNVFSVVLLLQILILDLRNTRFHNKISFWFEVGKVQGTKKNKHNLCLWKEFEAREMQTNKVLKILWNMTLSTKPRKISYFHYYLYHAYSILTIHFLIQFISILNVIIKSIIKEKILNVSHTCFLVNIHYPLDICIYIILSDNCEQR